MSSSLGRRFRTVCVEYRAFPGALQAASNLRLRIRDLESPRFEAVPSCIAGPSALK
jgi:hypothetical protein